MCSTVVPLKDAEVQSVFLSTFRLTFGDRNVLQRRINNSLIARSTTLSIQKDTESLLQEECEPLVVLHHGSLPVATLLLACWKARSPWRILTEPIRPTKVNLLKTGFPPHSSLPFPSHSHSHCTYRRRCCHSFLQSCQHEIIISFYCCSWLYCRCCRSNTAWLYLGADE